MDHSLTTIVQTVLMIADGVSLHGVDKEAFLEGMDISAAERQKPMSRMPTQRLLEAWRLAIAMTGEPLLPAKLGAHAHPMDYNLLGHIMLNSADLGSAIKTAAQYRNLVNNSVIADEEVQGQEMVYHLQLLPPLHLHDYARCPAERQFAGFLNVCRFLTSHTEHHLLKLNSIRFAHSPAADPGLYEEIYGCKVSFGWHRNEMRFDREMLSMGLYGPDQDILPLLLEKADYRLRLLSGNANFTDDVRRFVTADFRNGCPSAEQAASQFNMSLSTLKRKLQSEGSSYQEICGEVKKESAAFLLAQTQYPVSRIAYMLGYVDNSGFYAACRRWFGETPQQYREAALIDQGVGKKAVPALLDNP